MNSSNSDQKPDTPGLFQCGTCRRRYKRVDHLARHVRSHTQSRPYQCQVCTKAFGRPDLLKRHMTVHAEPGGGDKPRLSRNVPSLPSRVSSACRACASCHLRCSETKPCIRCTDRGLDCIWNQHTELGDSPSNPKSQLTELGESPIECEAAFSPQNPAELAITASPGFRPSGNIHDDVQLTLPESGSGKRLLEWDIDQPNSNTDKGIPDLTADGLLPNATMSSFPDLGMHTGQWTPMGVLHFDLQASMELDDLDLHFLNTYNSNIPFEIENGSDMSLEPAAVTPIPGFSNQNQPATIRSNAFRKFHWRFHPNVHDHTGADEHHLSLPSVVGDHSSPESRVALDRRVMSENLGVAARDRILTLVVDTCRPENVAKAVASFPSLELLDTLLQFYLTSPIVNADSFLHVGSFNPNKMRPELLASMAAAGAVLTADPTLTKLGLAIQECVRKATPKLWEANNTNVRDLQLSQAWYIALEVALWSGHSRKVEIAESFLQPLITMLRRNARFRRSGYLDIRLQHDDEGEVLEEKWRTWIEQESFKRLVFRLYQHDTDSSVALSVNTIISYAELLLPLPCSHEVWSAPSAQHWKPLHLMQTSPRPLTVIDCLDDPELINTGRATADATAMSLVYLGSVWRMAWEYLQLHYFQKATQRQWNGVLMASRKDELLKMLSHFRLCLDSSSSYSQDIIIRLELILLHLHMPFDDVQTFAGVEGSDQTRAAYPAVTEWVQSEAARKAIWHAGQIIRVAKLLNKTMLQGPIAVMVYHASLALWVFGLLSGVTESNNSSNNLQSGSADLNPTLWLDNEGDSIMLQRFIQLGKGQPAIRGLEMPQNSNSSSFEAYLNQPDRVMEAISGIMCSNHPSSSRPPLVHNLVQLLGELRRSSGKTKELIA